MMFFGTFVSDHIVFSDLSSVPKLLVDLHVKLLRKIGKSVSADRWEKYLVKVTITLNLYMYLHIMHV